MKPQINTNKHGYNKKKISVSICVNLWIISLAFLLVSCSEIRSPKPEVFIGKPAPPTRKQEFRWSNGKMPKSFDPARASASPEADFVRALYEGLTDLDSKTLKPVPAIATKWTASEDFKTWTFQLRDAKWSNGVPITAQDFVRSWKRLAELGAVVSQRDLLKNIVGMDTENALPVFSNKDEDIFSKESDIVNSLHETSSSNEEKNSESNSNTNGVSEPKITQNPKPAGIPKKKSKKKKIKPQKIVINPLNFGVQAVKDNLLKVTLKQADENFPALVAHPIFRPVFGEGDEFDTDELSTDIVTNGAFRLVSTGKDGIQLERAENFWNKNQVELESVKFVVTESAESALAAYRAGEIDVLTNANFAPLALKLLTPFDEFRRTKHSALNFYEFNLNQKPFDDHRVREALTIAIQRERLTEDEMDGATDPALSFLPFENETQLLQDIAQAKKLLTDAGFANGANFPVVHLVINRNDLQKRIARSVAKMWKKNLNIDTEIVIKEPDDFEEAVQNGEFDVVRRGIVLPTADETANMMAMFEPRVAPPIQPETQVTDNKPTNENQILTDKTAESKLDFNETAEIPKEKSQIIQKTDVKIQNQQILTEEQAMESLPAIPLYFPSSYSLVKPYVIGFDSNALDAPSLKNVKINYDWQPSNRKTISNGQ